MSYRALTQHTASKVSVGGMCDLQNLGFNCSQGMKDTKDLIIGFVLGQTIKQVGGCYKSLFVVTQSAIYSTKYANYSENGDRTPVSEYWG